MSILKGDYMNLKKILVFTVILITLCMAASVVSASLLEPIDIGDITHYNLDMTNFNDETDEVDFTTTADIDISDLSASDKKLLEDAIKDKKTAFILNLTAGSAVKITLWSYKGVDEADINGDTLHIKHDSAYRSLTGEGMEDLDLVAISFNTTEGQLFTTDV